MTHNQDKYQSIQTDLEMTSKMEIADFKRIIKNILERFRENHEKNEKCKKGPNETSRAEKFNI